MSLEPTSQLPIYQVTRPWLQKYVVNWKMRVYLSCSSLSRSSKKKHLQQTPKWKIENLFLLSQTISASAALFVWSFRETPNAILGEWRVEGGSQYKPFQIPHLSKGKGKGETFPKVCGWCWMQFAQFLCQLILEEQLCWSKNPLVFLVAYIKLYQYMDPWGLTKPLRNDAWKTTFLLGRATLQGLT